MNLAVGMIAAPRPKPTLERSLASLARAGFSSPRVFMDHERRGSLHNWLDAVRTLLAERADADGLLVVEDDGVFCRNLRRYLEVTMWPPGPRIALCSPYCPGPYKQPSAGWHREDRGWDLVGSLCWVIPVLTAARLVANLSGVKAFRHIDAHVGRWAEKEGYGAWYHTPSLVQHIGNGNSALGDESRAPNRSAADFVGEDYDAMALIT